MWASNVKMKKLLFFMLVLFLILPLASAECLTVQLSKQSYFSGELLQAEISGALQKPLTIDDIRFFKDSQKYFPAFDFEQIAADKWILWTNVPTNYGENKLKVSGFCQEEILKEETVEFSFFIQRPLQDAYNWLKSEVDEQWSLYSPEENALAMKALSYDSELFEKGRFALLTQSYIQECFPSAKCEVKPTAISLSTLKDTAYAQKINNWLLDSQNNLDIGLWDLIITSDIEQSCILGINGEETNISLVEGQNSPISLALPDTSEVSLAITNCPMINAKVSHTYLGRVREFPFTLNGMNQSLILDNNKCWGKEYRTACDAESTAFAIMTLEELGVTGLQKEKDWLKNNVESTLERAIYYLLTSDASTQTWLINNQAPEGYWAERALALSQTPDILSTVFATKSLSGNSRTKGEAWLKDKFEAEGNFGGVKETAVALQLFSADKIEPLISSKGLEKVTGGEELNLKFRNNGVLETNLTISLFGQTKQLSLSPFSEQGVVFVAPFYKELAFKDVEVMYLTTLSNVKRSYNFPIAVFPSGTKDLEQEDILTKNPSGEGSLFPAELKFTPEKIEQDVIKQTELKLTANIENLASSPVEVSINVLGLSEIIQNVEPSNFELQSGQSMPLTITFNTENAFGSYLGSINAEMIGYSATLPVTLTITEEQIIGEETEETVVEEEKKPFNLKAIGWTIFVLALVLGGYLIYLKLKKPKKPALDIALEKVGMQTLKR